MHSNNAPSPQRLEPRPSRALASIAAAALTAVSVTALAGVPSADNCSQSPTDAGSDRSSVCLSQAPEQPRSPAPLDGIGLEFRDLPFLVDRSPFPVPFETRIISSKGIINLDHAGYFWSANRRDGLYGRQCSPWWLVNRAILHFFVVENLLQHGEHVTFELTINDVPVGLRTVNAGQVGALSMNVDFPPILGPVELFEDWSDGYPDVVGYCVNYDVAFRVVTEPDWIIPGLPGGVTLALADNSRGYQTSLELMGDTHENSIPPILCLEFEHYLDAITFTEPPEGDFSGAVVASWENIDTRGDEVEMSGYIEDGIGTFTCDLPDCPEGQDWEFRIDFNQRTSDLKNLTTGVTHRAGWPAILSEGVCPL